MEEIKSKNKRPQIPDYEKVFESFSKPEGMSDEQWAIQQASIIKRLEGAMMGCELTN